MVTWSVRMLERGESSWVRIPKGKVVIANSIQGRHIYLEGLEDMVFNLGVFDYAGGSTLSYESLLIQSTRLVNDGGIKQ